jgi:hypothetical protein
VECKKWTGWTCERRCWNVPDRSIEATEVEAEFDAHSCEAFARANWDTADTSSES